MNRLLRSTILILLGMALGTILPAQHLLRAPIGQITKLYGAMRNQLTGLGLVTGLSGTGSTDTATRQVAASFIRNFDVNVEDSDLTTGSFAMVSVTATLPPFAREGDRLDLTVSLIGDASSLFGGVLQFAELKGPDLIVHATGGGSITVGGISAAGQTARVSRNHVTVGHVPDGGKVVEGIRSFFLSDKGDLELSLINPSLATAEATAVGINRVLAKTGGHASVVDPRMVRITLPEKLQTDKDAIRILNLIRDVQVKVENPKTVIIDETTGLVIAGEGVLISPCVVALADLTISVTSEDEVVQPLPGINQGRTAVVNRTRIDITTDNTQLKPVSGGATVGELLSNLKALQLSPRQLIEVFQALKKGGYLHARLLSR